LSKGLVGLVSRDVQCVSRLGLDKPCVPCDVRAGKNRQDQNVKIRLILPACGKRTCPAIPFSAPNWFSMNPIQVFAEETLQREKLFRFETTEWHQ
jgi:hypothetical protein